MIQRAEPVKLTSELIEAFAGMYLSKMYDNPQPVAEFHRLSWDLYCDMDQELAGVIAPREHAKSTALTHSFTLAVVCFRVQDYVVITSATEDLAMDHLGDIAAQLRENEDLRKDFMIESLPVDARGEVIVKFTDGHMARFIAKGSGQKMRGLKWRGKRPGLIIGDDLEEDEQVENIARRKKFQRWVNRALIPCKRRGGIVRIHGTVLHEDSYLARIRKNSTWKTLFFKAHAGFDDFTDILWPEQFPESRLRKIRQRFIDDNDASGYSQEYMNDPFDNSEAYIRKDDLKPMLLDDYDTDKVKYAGIDFAISKSDRANRTSITVGGKDSQNIVHIIDQRVGRWDTYEIIHQIFAVQRAHRPDAIFVENGHIWKTLKPVIIRDMLKADMFINFVEITPVKDKNVRGRPFQARARAHAVRFDKQAEWYPPYEAEILRFTGMGEAIADDQFDSTATLFIGMEKMAEVDEEDFLDEEEYDRIEHDPRKNLGRDPVTGY